MVTVAEDYSASGLQRRRKLQDGSGVSPLWANDLVTGLYYERARWYSASLGTWISQDHLSYINGANTHQFVISNPAGNMDSSGLLAWYYWVAGDGSSTSLPGIGLPPLPLAVPGVVPLPGGVVP